MEHRSVFPHDVMGFLVTAIIGLAAPFLFPAHGRLLSALLVGALLVSLAHVLFKTGVFRRYTRDLAGMSYPAAAFFFLVVAFGMHAVISFMFAGAVLIAQGR